LSGFSGNDLFLAVRLSFVPSCENRVKILLYCDLIYQEFKHNAVYKKGNYYGGNKKERENQTAAGFRHYSYNEFNVYERKDDETQQGNKNIKHGRSKNEQQGIGLFIHLSPPSPSFWDLSEWLKTAKNSKLPRMNPRC
jgi:hypothetical protein